MDGQEDEEYLGPSSLAIYIDASRGLFYVLNSLGSHSEQSYLVNNVEMMVVHMLTVWYHQPSDRSCSNVRAVY